MLFLGQRTELHIARECHTCYIYVTVFFLLSLFFSPTRFLRYGRGLFIYSGICKNHIALGHTLFRAFFF